MTDRRGTALHLACAQSHPEIVKLLLDSHASMTLEDPNGKIPLELATNEEILEMIPRYMGLEQLKKYRISDEDDKPASFSGYVYWTSSIMINDRHIFLVLDIEQGRLNHYNRRDAFLDNFNPDYCIQLIDIQNVRSLSRNVFGKPQHMFIVTSKDIILKYYSLYPEITSEWSSKILEACRFCQLHYIPRRKTIEENKEAAVAPRVPEDYRNQAWRLSIPQDSFEEDVILEDSLSTGPSSFNGEEPEHISLQSFTILHQIGEGSFGKVYKIAKNSDGRIFALKSLNKAELAKNKYLKYAIRECRIMKELRHPFIVPLYFAFQTTESLYMVMEYCPNGDLLNHLEEQTKLEESRVRFYIAEMLLAIEYLHSFDILYRDIKAENVLIDIQGHVKLVDFGLAKKNINENKLARSFCGSPAYISPELLYNKGSGKPADIYGVGALMYELLTGLPPYFTEDIKKLYENIRKAKLKFPSYIKEDAKNILRKMLDRDPAKRPSVPQLKTHPFFKGIDWEALKSREAIPPRLGPNWQQRAMFEELRVDPATLAKSKASSPGKLHRIDEEDVIMDF